MLCAVRMDKAVLDSSVLVSAFLKADSLPAALLDHARAGAFSLCLSREILTETTEALLRPKLIERYRYTPEEVAEYETTLAQAATLVHDLPDLHGAVPLDPDDDMIVATAVKAKADYLVSGDRHLLSLGEHDGIPIIAPRAFLPLIDPETAS